MPAEAEEDLWKHNPFASTVTNGKAYTDHKGACAIRPAHIDCRQATA